MASPTYAEIRDWLRSCVYLLHLIRDRAEITAETIVTRVDTIQQLAEGDYSAEVLAAVDAIRQRYAACLSRAGAEAVILPHLIHLAKLNNWPERTTDAIMGRFYDYCITNSLTVKARNITRGAISAGGSNVGTGTINRLTKDENDYPLEACNVEVKTFECLQDSNSATSKGEESFNVYGKQASKDGLDTLGSGINGTTRAVSARDTAVLIDNPSFETYSGTAAVPTDITGWTINTIGNVSVETTGTASYFYRTYPESTTSYSLKLSGNVTVTRALGQQKLSPSNPYYVQIAYNRQTGLGDGNLTIALGASTVTVALVAQAGWNILRIALDKSLWFKRFNQANLSLVITLDSRTTGYTLIDDVILVPMTQVDGTYFTIVGGVTNFLRRDIFTFTDTLAGSESILQYWLVRGTGHYLPAVTDGSQTIAEPS